MSNIHRPTILILHGWGLQGNVYKELLRLFKQKEFRVLAPDLPGFGTEPLKKKTMTLNDYIEFVDNFIPKNIKGRYVIIGHSFGGRIAIKFTSSHPKNLSGLILTGAAGIRHPLSMRSTIAFYFAKYLVVLFTIPPFSQWRGFFQKFLYYFTGELDYYKAGHLKDTFKKIIAEDLTKYLTKISVPSLLVWGEKDRVIPISDGQFMNKHIKKSRLIAIRDATHKLPYQKPRLFLNACLPFLQKI